MTQKRTKYDAFLLVSFGGPEGMSDVMPFLKNVLHGRNIPEQRMLAVAHHYQLFGGVSPINEQNRQLIAALKPVIELSGPKLPIYWGNRNWHPLLTDTVKQMANDGIKNAIALATAAYSSYSGCRQYLENIENARILAGANAPKIDKIRPFYNHADFIAVNAQRLLTALEQVPAQRRQGAEVVFTAHSIPLAMANACRYEAQLKETAQLVISQAGVANPWRLVYQSRSGSPGQPWLEPDINVCIKELAVQNKLDIVISPIGFVSDHMEILYDLDTEAKQLCDNLGVNYLRAKTAGNDPKFVSMIQSLVAEQMTGQDDNICSPESKIDGQFCTINCCPVS